MADNEINVANLYQDIGALKAMTQEHTRQTSELADLIRGISANMATKADIHELSTGVDSRMTAMNKRVTSLETDRRIVKAAAGVAVGAPPVLAAVVEVIRFVVGHH